MTSAKSNTAAQLSAAAKKAFRERDAVMALREYQAEQARIDANTARLRALRLAKEAAEAAGDWKPPGRVATLVRAARSRGSA